MNLQGTALTDLLNMLGFEVTTEETKVFLLIAIGVMVLLIIKQERNGN